MCRTADNIFDGGLSDVRGDREYQRSRGYQTPSLLPASVHDNNFPPCPLPEHITEDRIAFYRRPYTFAR